MGGVQKDCAQTWAVSAVGKHRHAYDFSDDLETAEMAFPNTPDGMAWAMNVLADQMQRNEDGEG